MNKRITGNTIGKYLIRNTIAEYLGKKTIFKSQEDFNKYKMLLNTDKQHINFAKFSQLNNIIVTLINFHNSFKNNIDIYLKSEYSNNSFIVSVLSHDFDNIDISIGNKEKGEEKELNYEQKDSLYWLIVKNIKEHNRHAENTIKTLNLLQNDININAICNTVYDLISDIYKIKELKELKYNLDYEFIKDFNIMNTQYRTTLIHYNDDIEKKEYIYNNMQNIKYKINFNDNTLLEVKEKIKNIDDNTSTTIIFDILNVLNNGVNYE